MQTVTICVRGQLDAHWSDWFAGLSISVGRRNETVLSGAVADQAALYGLLAQLNDLGLALISVQCENDCSTEENYAYSEKHPEEHLSR